MHVHLPCCERGCILINTHLTEAGMVTSVVPTPRVCAQLIGRPNTTWHVVQGDHNYSLVPYTNGPGVRPVVRNIASINCSASRQVAPSESPVAARTIGTQTPPVVVLDAQIDCPPALFAPIMVSGQQFSIFHLGGVGGGGGQGARSAENYSNTL